ncbi:DUF192 domain-containing protein [Salinibacillus xinjiangensis]|uniref:DUF192 domain-containing protein n=1 Tax=Salinibacillus xinjiangensis TaxID=1229268 RepID=A0A6G1X4H8_9BACI|nr:DUF192 domain-containing protein [Salinibacillus xinjiangensis]MRG85806.1 DUF192 domain-containing protein [Salinibacillus xinjiangensis]
MEIIRKNIKYEVPIDLKFYNTFWKRFKGLMFKVKPLKQEGIIILPCNSIHMFFMFFSIDVIFINDEQRVLKTVNHLKPWRVVTPVRGAVAAIELPKGTIQKYDIQPNDEIHY